MLELDHIALAGLTLDDARQVAESGLGVELNNGGEHAVFHTHNALLGLEGGLYFEAIAINPHAPTPQRPRWFDLDNFSGIPRLTNWICRCPDLKSALRLFDEDVGEPVSLQRGDLRWSMAVPQSGRLPFDNMFPALIEWHTAPTPAERLPSSGVSLKSLIIRHPKADQLSDILSDHINEPRLQFETGDAGLSALFETPNGERRL